MHHEENAHAKAPEAGSRRCSTIHVCIQVVSRIPLEFERYLWRLAEL